MRTEDVQSLDENSSSSPRDCPDMERWWDYEATTPSVPLPDSQERSVGGGGGGGGAGGGARGELADDAHPGGERGEGSGRSSPLCPGGPPGPPASPVSGSGVSGMGASFMTSFAELEGHDTTTESSELNMSHPRPARALSLEVSRAPPPTKSYFTHYRRSAVTLSQFI